MLQAWKIRGRGMCAPHCILHTHARRVARNTWDSAHGGLGSEPCATDVLGTGPQGAPYVPTCCHQQSVPRRCVHNACDIFPLVQILDALSTREAHPDCPRAPGSHTCRLRHVWFWRGGGKQRPSSWKVGVGHAERRPSTWVGALSRGAASDAHESTRKPEPAFQSVESTLLVQNRPISGACAVLAPTRC